MITDTDRVNFLLAKCQPHIPFNVMERPFDMPTSLSSRKDLDEFITYDRARDDGKHKLVKQWLDGVEWHTECSCGAHWTQDRKKTEAYMAELFQSHVAYARHQAMTTL